MAPHGAAASHGVPLRFWQDRLLDSRSPRWALVARVLGAALPNLRG